MITAYHRPQTLDQALKLLSHPNTFPLGGGTFLSSPRSESVEVVDLQALGLSQINSLGTSLEIGATVTLQQLLNDGGITPPMKLALKLEAPLNLRNAASLAGTLVVADGRSTLTVAMLALDAKLSVQPEDQELLLGNYLPLRENKIRGQLITKITIPTLAKFAFEYVARTPRDKPIVCVGLARWPSGRTRLAVGGFGKVPSLALDGTEAEGLETAVRNACQEATDQWASAEYRQDVGAKLAARCLVSLGDN
jgi:putative selenate reductase FAD-binding subunit